MKKLFTLLCAAAVTTASQAEVKLWLESIKGDWSMNTTEYKYSDTNKVRQIIKKNNDKPISSYYQMFTYDSSDNLTRIAMYQDLLETFNYDEYVWMNYIDYKYNESGQCVERINYNHLKAKDHPYDPVFTLGGVLKYEYNLDGKLETVKTYLDDTLYQIDKYIYNDNGLLERREISYASTINQFVHGTNVYYIYDEGDQLIEIKQCDYDEDTKEETTNYCTLYTYDAQGNLTLQEKVDGTKNVVSQKFEYYYKPASFEYKLDEVAYPMNPEATRETELYQGLRHVLDKYDQWENNLDTGQLVKYDTFTCEYTDLYDLVRPGVKMVDMARPESAGLTFAGVSGNRLMLQGINPMDAVRIFNMEGRLVVSDTYRTSGLDVTNLPAGAYVVSTSNGCAKFVK